MAATLRLCSAVVGAVVVGTVGASVVTATAAPTAPSSRPAARTNTVTADRHDVKQWEQFRLHGKVTGIEAGTAVHLQQEQHGAWKTLPGTSVVNRSLDYSMRVELGIKGVDHIRTVVADRPSDAVSVTVH